MIDMEGRRAASQATLDRFKDAPLRYGTNDCARMAAFHLRTLGRTVKMPAAGSYRSPRSAMKALADRGYATLADALDDIGLERIAPAAALPGDILMLPGSDRLASLTIALGNGRVVGYHEDAPGATVLQPVEFEAAWRV